MPEGERGMLAALVRVMDDALGPTLDHRHLERVQHQVRLEVRGHGPAHDPPAVHVQDHREEQKARPGRHIGDVGHPKLVGRVAVKARCTRSAAGASTGPRRVVRTPRRRLTPTKPADRMSRATRFWPTGWPDSSRRSFQMRGAP